MAVQCPPECYDLPLYHTEGFETGQTKLCSCRHASGFWQCRRHLLFACKRSDMRRNRTSRAGPAGVRSALLTEAMTFLEPWILRNNFNSAIKRHQAISLSKNDKSFVRR